jgi:SAM-dependent methyltransferase
MTTTTTSGTAMSTSTDAAPEEAVAAAVQVTSCLACGRPMTARVVGLPELPVFCNVLAADAGEARRATRAPIELVQCETCGMIANACFDEKLAGYQPGYENSLHHSPTFQEWARGLAARLVAVHGLRDGTVLEIGSGGGGFLALLCEAGMAEGIGYDPSYRGEPDPSVVDSMRLDLRRGMFRAGDVRGADLAVCRHVLEHVTEPHVLVGLLRDAAPAGVLYLEVPDARAMLSDPRGAYDVIYEHVGYFGAPAMRALLARCELGVLDVRPEFGGQYLAVEAAEGSVGRTPGRGTEPTAEALCRAGEAFGTRTRTAMEAWADRLHRMERQGRDVVVWGAGSKGVTFVNLVEGGGTVRRVVDVNPLKRGRFVPVTAQPVVAPQDLVADPPDVVVVMNPLYGDEVGATLEGLGVAAEVVVA